MKYVIGELQEHWNDPFWWRHRFANHVVGRLNRVFLDEDSVDLTEREWDNLVILDGCRADLFEEAVDTENHVYSRVTSPSSKTPNWAQETFGDGEFGDIVYISSNPWIQEVVDGKFHRIVNVWQEVEGPITDVTPDEIHRYALDFHNRYPNKRLVVHYLQPHRPFINSANGLDEKSPWTAIAAGDLTYDIVWEEYKENLRIVWEDAVNLIDKLGGWTVLTSDHGNMMGERAPIIPVRVYGHPGGVRAPELVEVPYVEFKEGDRRQTTSGEIGDAEDIDDSVVRDRLRDLGYYE